MVPSSATVNNIRHLRARLVIAALAGCIPIALVVQWSDLLVGGTMMAGPFPPLAACILWSLVLVVQNLARRNGEKRKFFNRSEMLALLAVWIAANMVVGRGLLHPLLSALVGPTYYAKTGALARAIPRDLPSWLAVTDKAAAAGFFEGHGQLVPWSLWRSPLITWAALFVPFLIANICMVSLFERVWVRDEKLSFPLVALPLEAVSESTGPSRELLKRSMLVGLVFPLLLHGFGVAHAYLPTIPCIPFFNDLSSIVTVPPWTALKPLYLNLYPLLIGLTFLAPTDVTFSVWFFLVLNKLEMVVAGASGWSDGSTGGGSGSAPPFLEEQSAGAYLALCTALMWSARRHLAGIARVCGGTFVMRFFPSSKRTFAEEQIKELATYRQFRLPAWGMILAVGGTLFWCSRTGMPLWFSICFFGFYFAVAMVLSRLMAEGGVSWILAPILPDKLIFGIAGSAIASPAQITRLSLQVQHLRDTRQMICPAAMEGGKLRDEAGISPVSFYSLMLACMGAALIVGCAAALPILYGHGALSLTPNSDGLMMSASVAPLTGVNQASARLMHATPPSAGAAGGLAVGAAITFALSVLRVKYSWWPLHPLGYALTGTMQLGYANKMLFSIFLGWLFKTVTLRFGGVNGFKYLRGVALGLILGDLLMGTILKILDAILGPSGYAIF